MRRTLKRTSFLGMRSRAYRCRLERLESRSMLAADVAEAAVDPVPDEMAATESTDPIVVDEWQACDPAVCDLQPYDFVDSTPAVDPVIIDDSCLMVDGPAPMAYEPVDIRVQFISSETESGWAAYYYTVGADGTVQGVSVVASYDDPTIAAFVAEHADDPSAQISDYGDGWWIGGFPLELAPPVPEYGVFFGAGAATSCGSTDAGLGDASGSLTVVGDWSWDGSCGVYTWDQGGDAGVDWSGETSGWDFVDWSGSAYDGSWDGSGPVDSRDWSWCGWSAAGADGGDGTETPLFYARGAGVEVPSADGFVASSMSADAEPAAEPVAVSPRSAAFADMSAMAAAATAAPASFADAVPFGGGRRRR